MEPPRIPGGPRGVPVPLLVLGAAVAVVVLWPRLAPAPVPLPDERPLAIPTVTHAGPRHGGPASRPRGARRDPAALAAQAPPGPGAAAKPAEATGAPRREAAPRGRRVRSGAPARRRRHRGSPSRVAVPPSPTRVPRATAPPRRWDGDLLP